MRKTIALLLSAIMAFSLVGPALADEPSEEYYTVNVEYSDNIGQREPLRLMVKDGNVFADARALAERLGYDFGGDGTNDTGAVIRNQDASGGVPFNFTVFEYGSTRVKHALFDKIYDTYEAPFASVLNDEGAWIPLQYSLLLLDSGMMSTDDALLIDMPTKNIVDYFYDIAKKTDEYGFDWVDDFGYTDFDFKALGATGHMVNVFNGVLGLDGASWLTLFQQFAGNMNAYDKKYGEKLAILLCTESNDELEASGKKVDMLTDLVSKDGALGEILSSKSEMLDAQVGNLSKICEDTLQGVKDGNTALVTYNRSYQALEKALDKQTWFSKTGGTILEVQRGVSGAVGNAFNLLKVGTMVLEAVGYAEEFQKQDEFSLSAMTRYLGNPSSGPGLPGKMRESMSDYAKALSKDLDGYMSERFKDNAGKWLKSASELAEMVSGVKVLPSLHEVVGMQAAGALLAWDIASNTIPFISNGLSGADNYELALYSQLLQSDSLITYQQIRNTVFSGDDVSAKDLYELSQFCYAYLKSCYVTREAALGSLAGKSDSVKEKIQPLVDQQHEINAEIARILVELKGANETNEGNVYGFLPSDNAECLEDYDDSALARWVATSDVGDATPQPGKDDEDTGTPSDERPASDMTFSSASEAYAAVIEEWRDRIEYDKTEEASGAMRNAGNWYYSVSPSYVAAGSDENGDDFVYCYRSYDAFDEPMLVVAGSTGEHRVYGMYQYVAKENAVAIYTAHFRHHKFLCEDQCLRAWNNTAGGSDYSTAYWSERPSGYHADTGEYGKRCYLDFSPLETFLYNAGSDPTRLGELTDLAGAKTMVSIEDGCKTIDDLHPAVTSVDWHRILDPFVTLGESAELAQSDGQAPFSATLDNLKAQAQEGDFFGGLDYQLADLDGDGTDELFVTFLSGSWSETTSRIYKEQSGEVTRVFDSVRRGGYFQYCYPQTRTVVFQMIYKAMIYTWYYQYEDGTMVQKAAMFDGRSYNGSLSYQSAEGVEISDGEYLALASELESGEACQLLLDTTW